MIQFVGFLFLSVFLCSAIFVKYHQSTDSFLGYGLHLSAPQVHIYRIYRPEVPPKYSYTDYYMYFKSFLVIYVFLIADHCCWKAYC